MKIKLWLKTLFPFICIQCGLMGILRPAVDTTGEKATDKYDAQGRYEDYLS